MNHDNSLEISLLFLFCLRNWNWYRMLQSGMIQFYFIILPDVIRFSIKKKIWKIYFYNLHIRKQYRQMYYQFIIHIHTLQIDNFIWLTYVFYFSKMIRYHLWTPSKQMSWKNERTCTFGTWHDEKVLQGCRSWGDPGGGLIPPPSFGR